MRVQIERRNGRPGVWLPAEALGLARAEPGTEIELSVTAALAGEDVQSSPAGTPPPKRGGRLESEGIGWGIDSDW